MDQLIEKYFNMVVKISSYYTRNFSEEIKKDARAAAICELVEIAKKVKEENFQHPKLESYIRICVKGKVLETLSTRFPVCICNKTYGLLKIKPTITPIDLFVDLLESNYRPDKDIIAKDIKEMLMLWLTTRQKNILMLLLEGYDFKEIGQKLNLSYRQVYTNIQYIRERTKELLKS